MDSTFWSGKKVLITGHTGFKGSWLSLWLQRLGAHVIGFSLAPVTQPNLYDIAQVAEGMCSVIGDIRDIGLVHQVFQQHKPDIVIHMAAQAIVRYSYLEPIETYQTNVMGTLNILEGIRACETVKAAVMVTTDKCYDNKERDAPYSEDDVLGGHDPYSSSKACAEILISSYRRSFFADESLAAIASVRAGNVIGGGDWSTDRLIPDIIKSSKKQKRLVIRSPNAIRPWQYVLDPLCGYLLLAEQLFKQGHSYAQAWNFGPLENDLKQVNWIADYFSDNLAGFSWATAKEPQLHEASILKLDCTKAHELLGWTPYFSINKTLDSIVEWHQDLDNGRNMRSVCNIQIEQFLNRAGISIS